MTLSDRLQFDLAWNKTKSNLRDSSRIFLNDPHIVDILDRNQEEYIDYLEDKVDTGFHPSESRIVNIPKSNWNIRPGSVLEIDDLTIYSALVLTLYEDIRDAIEALELLTELYRDRGLNLQREKTQIVDSQAAEKRLEDPDRVIEDLEPKVGGRIKRQGEGGSPYDGSTGGQFTGSPSPDGGEREGLESDDVDIDVALLESAFDEHIREDESFDQHLFRYLITRLGILDSTHAVSYCLDRIHQGKTETRHILDRYFSRLEQKESIANELAELLDSGEIIYDFQEFVIVRWFHQTDVATNRVVKIMRHLLRDGHSIPETENYVIAYLGNHGDRADLESIREMYDSSRNRIQEATILMAIRNMEESIRNSIYGRAEDDDIYCSFAAQFAKEKAGD